MRHRQAKQLIMHHQWPAPAFQTDLWPRLCPDIARCQTGTANKRVAGVGRFGHRQKTVPIAIQGCLILGLPYSRAEDV